MKARLGAAFVIIAGSTGFSNAYVAPAEASTNPCVDGNWTYNAATYTCTRTVNNSTTVTVPTGTSMTYLIVGGGGGGAPHPTSTGGAGGQVVEASGNVTGAITVTIGAGGGANAAGGATSLSGGLIASASGGAAGGSTGSQGTLSSLSGSSVRYGEHAPSSSGFQGGNGAGGGGGYQQLQGQGCHFNKYPGRGTKGDLCERGETSDWDSYYYSGEWVSIAGKSGGSGVVVLQYQVFAATSSTTVAPAPTTVAPAPTTVAPAPTVEELPTTDNRPITICHWNASGTWVSLTVDSNSLNRHGNHPNDIIPAPAGGCGNRAVTRVLTSTTTTTVPVGSLQDTKNKVNEERKGGKDKGVLDVVKIDATPKSNGGGGSLEITPKDNGPGVQLLSATSSDPKVQVKVKSSGSDYNKPDTWVNEGFGSYCWKIESFNGEYLYTLPSPPNPPDSRYAGLAYSAVKVKAGSIQETDPAYQVDTIYMNPAPGSVVFADSNKNGESDPGGQGGGTLGDKEISHVILCVGASSFPGIQTTATTVPGSDSTTTTTPGSSTTLPAGSSATTTTLPGSSATTTLPGSSATTTTTPGSSATTTTVPGSSATTTTVPGGPAVKRSSIEVEIIEPDDGIRRQLVDIEFVVSTGTDVQTVYLTVNLPRFSVEQPTALSVLPETGTESGAQRLWLGFGLLLAGLAIIAGRIRSVVGRRA